MDNELIDDMSNYSENWLAAIPDTLESYNESEAQTFALKFPEFHMKRKLRNIGEFIYPYRLRKRFRDRFFGVTVTGDEESIGEELIDAIDASLIDEHNIVGAGTPRMRFHWISELVAECKTTLPGITIETSANRLVAERWLGDRMRDRKMRPRHIKSMLPLAIESVFIPDQYQIEARRLRQSSAVQERVNQGRDVVYSRSKPWLLNWFGTRSRRAEPSPI